MHITINIAVKTAQYQYPPIAESMIEVTADSTPSLAEAVQNLVRTTWVKAQEKRAAAPPEVTTTEAPPQPEQIAF